MDKQFEWSEIDELEEDRETLLNDFKRDLANGDDPLNANDLEEGILPKKHVHVRAPPKMTNDDRKKA